MSKEDIINIQDVFEKSSFTDELNSSRLRKISSEIPILKTCEHKNYLSLFKYFYNIPEKFYNKKACWDNYNFLEKLKNEDINALVSLLVTFNEDSSLLFVSLDDINALNFHDIKISSNEYELISFLDMHFHISYLKLTESAFSNLIYPLSYYQRRKRGAKLEGFDVFQRVAELKNTEYNYLINPYDHTIRNAIAHGGIIYNPPNEITYKDKKSSVSVNTRKIVEIFDEMLDICNGLLLGYRLFYCINYGFLEENGIQIPLSIVTEEFKAEMSAPGWEIKKCFESKTYDNRKQLMVFTHNTFLDSKKLKFNVMRSAFFARKYTPNYERYFFSLVSKYSTVGFASFNMYESKMNKSDKINESTEYNDLFKNVEFFFMPRLKLPSFIFKITTFISLFRIHYSLKKEELSTNKNRLSIDVRYTTIHKNGFHSIIKGTVVVKSKHNTQLDDLIRENHSLIVKSVIKSARKKTKYRDISSYLRIGFIHISVFSDDFRIRKLTNSGLIPELICTIEQKKLARIRQVDIYKGVPEIRGRSRIVWNQNYLDKK
jgi:hypothetical protein